MEKRNVGGLLGKDRECKAIFVYVNDHQRMFATEEALSNQVDKMACSVEDRQPLSPDTQHLFNEPMNKMTMEGWKLDIDSTTWTSHYQD